MERKLQIIAEVKTKSPFGFESKKSWEELFKIAEKHGDIISIHTNPRWGGSFDLIRKAKRLTNKPILAKGIHETDAEIKEVIKAGADYVLVVGRIPTIHQDKCLVEPLSLSELATVPKNIKAVWNSRDLANGKLKSEAFEDARKMFKGYLCQASNIKTIQDVKDGADAVLVGENLESFIESCKKAGLI